MLVKVGEISLRLIQLLGLTCAPGTPIFMGPSNIEHMKNKHPDDFNTYHDQIPSILSSPDYVRKSSDGSIEYVKEFRYNSEYVKEMCIRDRAHSMHRTISSAQTK